MIQDVTDFLILRGDFMLEVLAIIPLALAALIFLTFIRSIAGQWLGKKS